FRDINVCTPNGHDVILHHTWGGRVPPPLEKKKAGEVGTTPLPPLPASGTFSAWPDPVVRVELPAWNVGFGDFPGLWRIARPGPEGGGGTPLLGRHMGGRVPPTWKKEERGGRCHPPPPPPSTPPVTPTPVPLLPARILTAKYHRGAISFHAKHFSLHDPGR